MTTPTPDDRPHVGARVRLLGGGTGEIIAGPDPVTRQWTIALDNPSYFPRDFGRRHITRTAGEVHVIDREVTR